MATIPESGGPQFVPAQKPSKGEYRKLAKEGVMAGGQRAKFNSQTFLDHMIANKIISSADSKRILENLGSKNEVGSLEDMRKKILSSIKELKIGSENAEQANRINNYFKIPTPPSRPSMAEMKLEDMFTEEEIQALSEQSTSSRSSDSSGRSVNDGKYDDVFKFLNLSKEEESKLSNTLELLVQDPKYKAQDAVTDIGCACLELVRSKTLSSDAFNRIMAELEKYKP